MGKRCPSKLRHVSLLPITPAEQMMSPQEWIPGKGLRTVAVNKWSFKPHSKIIDKVWGIFFLGAAEKYHADPITWFSEDSIFMDQWPLTKEKILPAQEQLDKGYTEELKSPWNSPILWLMVRKMTSAARSSLSKGINGTFTTTPSNIHYYS